MGRLAPVAFLLILPLLNTLSTQAQTSRGVISTYWGQHGDQDEGTLKHACETGLYGIVNVAYLDQFGEGREPKVNLAGHCTNCDTGGCTCIGSDITYCQQKGVKVFLTIGGTGNYTLNSTDDAKQVAKYLWESFLEGKTKPGLLGDAVLDGIDFFINEGTDQYWDDLAKALYQYGQKGKKKLFLSALVQCVYPAYWMHKALDTGLFDYVTLEFFYNPQCQYVEGHADRLFKAWNNWSSHLNTTNLMLGVPASQIATGGGYIRPEDIRKSILPTIKGTAIYGGVMVWDRYWDAKTNYSAQIKSDVPLSSMGFYSII